MALYCHTEAGDILKLRDAKVQFHYMPYEGLISTNQHDRKLDVYDRKLEGSHSTQG